MYLTNQRKIIEFKIQYYNSVPRTYDLQNELDMNSLSNEFIVISLKTLT